MLRGLAGAFVHQTPVLVCLPRCCSPACLKQHCKPLTRLCLCSYIHLQPAFCISLYSSLHPPCVVAVLSICSVALPSQRWHKQCLPLQAFAASLWPFRTNGAVNAGAGSSCNSGGGEEPRQCVQTCASSGSKLGLRREGSHTLLHLL